LEKTCTLCGVVKSVSEFYLHTVKGRKYPTSRCKKCYCAKVKERAEKNPEKHRKQRRKTSKRYYYRHLEQMREHNRQCAEKYREQYPDRVRKSQQKYNQSDKSKEKMRRFNQTAKGKARWARGRHNRRTREATLPCTLTADEWQDILQQYDFRCTYCGIRFSKKTPPTRDHVIPVIKGGGLTKENIVPACKSCNSRKHVNLWVA
jgi:hypothetical protein